MPERKPVRFLNYNNDVRPVDKTRPMGPTMLGEWVWPVTEEYNEKTNVTRVGFSFVPPPKDES